MGRKRRHNRQFPENWRESHGAHYLTAYIDGKQRWIPLGRDVEAAWKKYRELTATSAPIGHTVEDLAGRYEREILPGLKPNTRRSYRTWLEPIRKTWGHMAVADIRQHHAAEFQDAYPDTVTGNRVVSLLSTILKKAVRWGWIERNPMVGYEKQPERRRTRILSDEEWFRILPAADPSVRLLLRLARFTALRKDDICRLRWSSVRDGRLEVHTRKTEAPVSFQVAGELEAILAEARGSVTPFPSRPLFLTTTGRAFSSRNLDNYWWAACEAAHVEGVVFHDIRRTRLTELREKYGLELAQRTAAHADPRTTERYYVPEAVRVDWPEAEIRGWIKGK